MAYTKTTWVDEVLAGAERFDIEDNVGTPIETNVQIKLATGVTVAGTPINATNLNKIEQALEDAHADGFVTETRIGNGAVTSDKLGALAVIAGKIANDAVTTATILNENVTAAKIANRTRTFLVMADKTASVDSAMYGTPLAPTGTTYAYGRFKVPSDFSSNLSVSAMVYCTAAGNAVLTSAYTYATVNEAYNNHSGSGTAGTYTTTANQIKAFDDASFVSATSGDYVFCSLTRSGDHASDTLASSVYVIGFLVSYTADS